MKSIRIYAVVVCLVLFTGCQNETTTSRKIVSSMPLGTTQIVNQMVEASCGECQFDMPGSSCDLAIRIDSKTYYVDGALLDDHGDAHAADGLCNSVRQAKVSGEIENGRFKATAFELLPLEAEWRQAGEGQSPSSR